MTKGQMSLEYIIKVVILLVVVAVVVAMIVKFRSQIESYIKCFFRDCEKNKCVTEFPYIDTKTSYSSGQIATFMESCYLTMTQCPEVEQRDQQCYVLIADTINANADDVLSRLDPEIRDRAQINTDFSRNAVIIEYKDVGNRIVVRDK